MVFNKAYGPAFTGLVHAFRVTHKTQEAIAKAVRKINYKASQASISRHLRQSLDRPPGKASGRPMTVSQRTVRRVKRGLTLGKYKSLVHAEESLADDSIHGPHTIIQRELAPTSVRWKRVIKVP